MKTSTFLFVLAGTSLLFRKATGTAGVISHVLTTLGLASIGAFLLVNGY